MFLRFTPALPITLCALLVLGGLALERARPSPEDAGPKGAAGPREAVAEAKALAPQASLAALLPAEALPAPPAALPAARMTGAQEADFEAWIVKTYLGCWKPPAQPADADAYVARVRLAFKPDGSLAKAPKLVNPPSDPALAPQAKSVMQAIQACNPLSVPAQYRPFYEQWKTKTIHFSPQVAAR